MKGGACRQSWGRPPPRCPPLRREKGLGDRPVGFSASLCGGAGAWLPWHRTHPPARHPALGQWACRGPRGSGHPLSFPSCPPTVTWAQPSVGPGRALLCARRVPVPLLLLLLRLEQLSPLFWGPLPALEMLAPVSAVGKTVLESVEYLPSGQTGVQVETSGGQRYKGCRERQGPHTGWQRADTRDVTLPPLAPACSVQCPHALGRLPWPGTFSPAGPAPPAQVLLCRPGRPQRAPLPGVGLDLRARRVQPKPLPGLRAPEDRSPPAQCCLCMGRGAPGVLFPPWASAPSSLKGPGGRSLGGRELPEMLQEGKPSHRHSTPARAGLSEHSLWVVCSEGRVPVGGFAVQPPGRTTGTGCPVSHRDSGTGPRGGLRAGGPPGLLRRAASPQRACPCPLSVLATALCLLTGPCRVPAVTLLLLADCRMHTRVAGWRCARGNPGRWEACEPEPDL